jgi:hypothetical protein
MRIVFFASPYYSLGHSNSEKARPAAYRNKASGLSKMMGKFAIKFAIKIHVMANFCPQVYFVA